MPRTIASSILAIAATLTLAVAAPAQQPKARPSARIQAFGGDAEPTRAPAPAPAPEPAAAPATSDARVLLGTVIPPPPHVEVSASGRPRPFDGRRGATEGSFVATPAAATRLAVNSPFGVRMDPVTGLLRMHTGVDLHADFGESVGASMSGTVWFAGERAGYGNLVVVDHGSGIATFYAHLSRIAVAAGQHVGAGELVGYVGSTGRSTGPHLHYEVRANGHPVDPSSQLALAGDQLLVNGQSVGAAASSGPVLLPKAPGGTSIAVDWGDDDTIQTATGQSLSVDWE